MKLLVLAGGFGTRLKAAISDVPKALAPVRGKPFLEIQLEHWLAQGVRDLTFLLHHEADQIIAFLLEQQTGILKDCQVNWLIEPIPMDTGGAIAHAVTELNLKDNFLMTNSDTWLGGGIHDLMLAVPPAMAVVNLTDISRYGQVYFDHNYHVTAFAEKNPLNETGWINAGLYHLNAKLFKDWNGYPFSLERDFFKKLVHAQTLKAVPLKTEFIDIGVPNDYYRFCRWVETKRQGIL